MGLYLYITQNHTLVKVAPAGVGARLLTPVRPTTDRAPKLLL